MRRRAISPHNQRGTVQGVGRGRGVDDADHELQEKVMKMARSASAMAGAKAGKGDGRGVSKGPSAPAIEFLGVGASANGDRFLKRRIRKNVALISVAKLISNPTDEYVRLQRAGLALLRRPARDAFIAQAEIEAGKRPTFLVATQPGLHGCRFCFPDDVVSVGAGDVEFYPDERHSDVYKKFLRAGGYEGWNQLVELSKGNSRLLFAYALACCGPVCAAFGLDPPGALFYGPGGWGKSTACKIPSAIWGWDPTPSTRVGFGFAWRSKVAALENRASGCNHTLLFLDEMSKASKDAVEAIMMISQGHATARYTELNLQTWSVPLLTNSNKSLLQLLLGLEFEFDAAHVDRLPDIPAPNNCTCFFENLHGSPTVEDYEARLRGIAEKNHGWAGRHYTERFTEALRTDRDELQAYIEAARQEYRAAAAGITSGWRDLVRLQGRSATIYASGRLGRRFGILPLEKEELLDAVLTCTRDHVAFIDAEVARLQVPVNSPRGALPTNSLQSVDGPRPAPKLSPYAKLLRYLDANFPDKLIDFRDPRVVLPEGHDHSKSSGYIGIHNKRIEVWFSTERFEKIAGGRREAQELKRKLVKLGLLMVWGRGQGKTGPTVRRRIGGLGLQYVVAIKPSKAMRARLPKLKKLDPIAGLPRDIR
jgi:hypothetical protein